MNFQLSEEHKMIRKMVRDFAKNEVAPTAEQRDEEESFDMKIFHQMAELGLTGIPWPEEYGGIGSDYLAYCIAVEELSRVDGSVGVILSAHTSLAGWPVYTFGTEEQKQKYLRPMAEGTKVGAYGLTEPSAGSDAGSMKTSAKEDGDHYVLNGSKIFITNGGIADIYVVFAVTDPDSKHKGTTAFIVEKDFEGFSVGKKEKNSESVRARRLKSSSTTAAYRKKTFLANWARALKLRCRRLMADATASQHKLSGSHKARWTQQWTTQKSVNNSASQSQRTKGFHSSLRTWRHRSKHHAC